jgi:ornithine cyclodeaminase/alanine dehydrogenase-like protein (mu-crystallin family)
LTLLLARADLERLLDVGEVIDACEQAFIAYSSGKTVTPLRVGVEPPGAGGVLLAMPCAVAEPAALGTKVVSVFRGNVSRGLPTITSIYLLSEYETGAPLAVMDGTYLTGIRTAAGSAVATKYLARSDARTLGVFGTGVQARFHVLAIARVRPIERVLVSATSHDKAQAFADWIAEATGLAAEATSAEDAARSDIVALCTTSATPVLGDGAVPPGGHVNAVGAFTPTTREIPTQLMASARVYVDSRAGSFSEAGDLLIPVQEGAFALDRVIGEVGELATGSVPARQSEADVTIYKSVGAAFLDAATARLAYSRAVSQGVGQPFTFA